MSGQLRDAAGWDDTKVALTVCPPSFEVHAVTVRVRCGDTVTTVEQRDRPGGAGLWFVFDSPGYGPVEKIEGSETLEEAVQKAKEHVYAKERRRLLMVALSNDVESMPVDIE